MYLCLNHTPREEKGVKWRTNSVLGKINNRINNNNRKEEDFLTRNRFTSKVSYYQNRKMLASRVTTLTWLCAIFYSRVALLANGEDACGDQGICNCYFEEEEAIPVFDVDCSYLGLTLPPSNFPPKTNNLLLSHNKLTALPEHIFSDMISLQTLLLSDNNLTTLPEHIFSDLISLQLLYLDSNKLASLPMHIFANLSNLEELGLFENNLTSLPVTIFSNLTNLQVLYLHRNVLTSLPVNLFSNLTNLKILYLQSENLEGLPEYIFASLTRLTELVLANNKLASLPVNIFFNQTRLRNMYLDRNVLTSLPANLFTNLTNLELIHLQSNNLQGLPRNIFASQTRLTVLDLSNNKLASLPGDIFFNQTSLQKLDLSNNTLASLPGNIFFNQTRLQKLDLSNNKLASLPGNIFFNQTKLLKLYLNSNNLTTLQADIFSRLVNLQMLLLSANKLTSLPVNIFFNLKNLFMLSPNKNSLTTLPEQIFSNLTNLDILDLSENSLTSLHENIFSELTCLSDLLLNRNNLTTLPEQIFRNLVGLKMLHFYQNSLQFLPEKLFANMSELQYLFLNKNNLTTLPEKIFWDLISLEKLVFYQNRLQYLPENVFANLSKLNDLDLSFNYLTVLPDQIFADLSALETLYLHGNRIEHLPRILLPSEGGHLNIRTIYLNKNNITHIKKEVFRGLCNLESLLIFDNKIHTIEPFAFIAGPQKLYLFNNEISELQANTFGQVLNELHLYGNTIPNLDLEFVSNHSGNLTLYVACDKIQSIEVPTLEGFQTKVITDSTVVNSFMASGFECDSGYVIPHICSPCKQGFYGKTTGGCQPCPPGGYYQDDIAKVSNIPNKVECKKCNAGTYVPFGEGVSSDDCIVCPEGTNKTIHAGFRACFCMDGYARTDRFNVCQICENNAVDCYGKDYKTLRKGYFWNWEYPGANLTEYKSFVANLMTESANFDPSTTKYSGDLPNVHSCPRSESCLNNKTDIEGTCETGYEGLMCSKCISNYYIVLGQCLECPELVYSILEVIGILLLVICIYVLLVWQYKKQKSKVLHGTKRALIDMFISRFKIVLGFYQVVGEFFTSLHELNWAGNLYVIGEFVAYIELNILRIFIRPNCFLKDLRINAKLEFIIAMTFLLLIMVVPFVIYQVKKCYYRISLPGTKSKLLTYVLAILFLTYPPICTIIFQLYPRACKRFCWDEQKKYCVEVLRSDFAIECKTLQMYQIFAFVATVLYVIAFPFCLFFSLWKKRSELSYHEQTLSSPVSRGDDITNPVTNTDDITHSSTPIWLTILCENYKDKYWFWEILELIRKVTQTVLITLLGWENRVTVLLTIGISVLFLILHARYLPMKSSFEQKLQMFALTAILINVLIAAIDHDESEDGLTVFLILLNLIVIAIVFGELLMNVFHILGKLQVHNKVMTCAVNALRRGKRLFKIRPKQVPLIDDKSNIQTEEKLK
ncbi:uncharacterized protein [Apostichopus japonicus]|uniref:uncharacterized protein isoform X2 n=1 Tax=Stichopus japonicus TaxID=307972 RepID=UPI003AB33500